jgi:hypothetical protein
MDSIQEEEEGKLNEIEDPETEGNQPGNFGLLLHSAQSHSAL